MSENTQVIRPRLAAVDRRQMVMRAIEVELLIEDDHSARSIWELVGRLDLSRYYAEIGSVEGRAGREHTDPQVLISLWLYAYSRGISSAREVARRCEHEPAFQWLCALQPISHRTLSGFRSGHQAALNDLFVQVLGMLSAEGLITLERAGWRRPPPFEVCGVRGSGPKLEIDYPPKSLAWRNRRPHNPEVCASPPESMKSPVTPAVHRRVTEVGRE